MSTGYPTDLILGIQGHQDTVHTISTITNLVSIICTSMVLLFLIAAQMLNGQLVKPMTVRLTIAIACTLWALSFVRLLYPTVSHDAISCQKIMITIIWFNNQYVFFSMALEMSIFCNLFSKEALSSSIEKWFYMTPVLLAFLTALFTAMFEVVGYNQDREACWYNVSATTWEYATLIAPQMLGVVSTFLGAFFLMILKVCRRHQAKLYDDGHEHYFVKTATLLHLFAPMLAQTGFIVSEIYMQQNFRISYWLTIWASLTTGLVGVFHFCGFLTDPVVWDVLADMRRDILHQDGASSISASNISPCSLRSFNARSYKLNEVDPSSFPQPTPLLPAPTMGSFTAFHTFTNTHSSMKPSQKMMRWIVIKLWPHHRQSTSRYRTPSPTVDMHYASSLNQSSQSSQSCMRQEDSLSFHETKMKTTPFSFTCEELVMDEPPNAILSPTTPHFTIPICFEELDSAVPWRVLEVDEDEQDIGDSFLQPKNSQDGTDPRKSLSSSPRTDSWLELNDDPPTSPSRVSQWFHKRGDSFENVRERMARSSKSLRRWRQQQQQQQQQSHPSDLQEPGLASLSTGTRQSRALSDSFDPTMLQAVPESPSEEESFNDTAVRAVTVLANSMHSNYRMI